MKSNILTMAAAICMLAAMEGKAQNPIIQTRYTSDPAPVVHGDTLYLYTGIDNEDGEGGIRKLSGMYIRQPIW